jgi:hypothetical protein
MARSLNVSPQPYLTLDRYRQIMNIPMCLFNGVENPDEAISGCDYCWPQWWRDLLAQALSDAEGTLADAMKFWLGARYLTSDGLHWQNPMVLPYGYIVGGGIQGLTEVVPVADDFAVDPATITVAAAAFPGGTDEILVVEDATGLEIVPDQIAAVGANYVIYIDQCKLIEWDNLEAQAVCIDYDDTFPAATWLKLADLTVYREYLDGSDQATITLAPDCDCCTCTEACSGTDYTGCVFVLNGEISQVRIAMADYSAGSWTCSYPTACGCYHGNTTSVNYLAGTTSIPGWEQAIIRLAHTYMAIEPCGCAMFDTVWQRDTHVPSVLTAERINCPFGTSDGAWWAWRWANRHSHGTAMILGKTDLVDKYKFLGF